MPSIDTLVDQLMSAAGELWFVALLLQFFAMICESAKPKPEEGESRAAPAGFALLVMILSLLTPLLLFFHAFLSGSGALIAIVASLFGAVILATLIGWLIGMAAKDVGRTLNRAAPVLALIAFALAVYVARDTVFPAIAAMVTGQAPAS